ncbi:hypothetical protein KY306_02100, partial [Candidatus Woesearchaeota archaeon]|nr:hypothetical protein [Candidatus Woesearchaeota archaeon]
AIHPSPWADGVTIRSVAPNSSASEAGFISPKAASTPLSKERIISIDNQPINNLEDYQNFIFSLEPEEIIHITTNKNTYTLETRPLYEELNQTSNKTTNKTPKIIGTQDLGLKVYDAPQSNIRKGLDLAGGTRVLIKPEGEVTRDDLGVVIDNLKERLHGYGLSDIIVREARDLSGDYFILVEIAGATEEEVRDLLARQGKFEAKIGNQTVFIGGERDITYVCRSAECSGLNPRIPCGQLESGQWACSFFFEVTLDPAAAARHAQITQDLDVISENNNQYLSQDLVLFLDDKEVDTLKIGAELKGKDTTNIQISGSGSGETIDLARFDTLKNMKRLQTILKTGSLPFKIEIIKMDTISPVLGHEFLNNAIFIGLLALVGVVVVITIRYRKIKIILPLATTLVSELILILGFAAIFGWNLDLAAIAGIVIAIGTGVDHLIVITDETLKGEVIYDWKKKIKNAMYIVFGAFLTTCAGMIPLWFAGAGILRGFAFTTIVGLIFGVFIARPAYAALIEILLKE